jgi:3-oxoacyl-[acyl-carrier-protein] synthase II
MGRSVVITGVGAVTGFGVGGEALWEGLLSGRSAIGRIGRFDPAGFPSRLAAEVRDFSAKDYVPKSYRKAVKVMARDIDLAVASARTAAQDASLVTREAASNGEEGDPTYDPARLGCQIGAGLIACDVPEMSMAMASAVGDDGAFSLTKWGESGMNNLTPLWLLKYLPNMLACHVTIIHGAKGPSNTITCSEASGLLSVGEARSVIRRGAADACFAGSAESKVNPMGLLRMQVLGRLAETGDEADATRFARPYATDAPGGLLGEVGGLVVIEDGEKARSRGARIYAEVIGFGAGHAPERFDPDRRAEGLVRAIENAFEDADVQASDIDAILPHASGEALMDASEATALRRIFGARLAEIPLVTLPPAIGEGMAGAGGAAVCAAALCVRHQTLPARIHAGGCPEDVQAGAAPARDAKIRTMLVCTNALGGQNAALVLRAV